MYEELPAVPTEGPVDDFPAPAELDPNNPVFQAIENISCYFYPLTKPPIPSMISTKNPLVEISGYYRILQNISNTLQTHKSGLSKLRKSQIAKFTLHPNVNERRIQSDFTYYQNLLTKQSEMLEMVFSRFELYKDIYSIFNRFSQFTLASVDADDIESIDLLKVGKELATEFENVERCFEGNEYFYHNS